MQDYCMNCFLTLIRVKEAEQLKDISARINLFSGGKGEGKIKCVKISRSLLLAPSLCSSFPQQSCKPFCTKSLSARNN